VATRRSELDDRAPAPALPRVFLRAPRPGDCEAFLARVAASRALHDGWVDPPGDRESYRAWSQRADSQRCAGRLVCLRGGGELVGVANLNDIERRGEARARLGFYGFAGHTGLGYVGEGVAELLSLAFGALGLSRVLAEVRPANARSRALLASLGFRRDTAPARTLHVGGAWRAHECWALGALAFGFRGGAGCPPGRSRRGARPDRFPAGGGGT